MPATTKRRRSSRSKSFCKNLLDWFDQSKRDLPWRKDRDPYRVWISEVMLQQTRVAAVIDHYHRFLRRFPTIEKLAAARESSVLAAWSGLGYYRRARMLHAAAKQVVKGNEGRFPNSAAEFFQLPGIGRYTAAAIASIAFNEPVAVVDGNVERVLARITGKRLSTKKCWEIADLLLSHERPGDFNQAMMELGATICLPRDPKCLLCPISTLCSTRGELKTPGDGSRQTKKAIRYAFGCRNGKVFLVQRPRTSSLMPGMWELPELSSGQDVTDAWLTVRHSITVTDYTVYVMKATAPEGSAGRWFSKTRLKTLPLTGLTRKILRAAQVI
ncbi:MAG TPA: A/G-specific adenine glycosylase [Terriglobales bacterium]|nr:A/G-specific adenine glycosylase [Terriglobales bacterium]